MLAATLLYMPVQMSSRPDDSDFYRVSDPTQARLLSDPESSRYFYPFWGRANTIAGAARELGRPINAVHYRVERFHAAGLLEVTRVEPRHGRPVKHYRSHSDAFFIPAGLGPHPDEEERFLADLTATLEQIARGMTAPKRNEPISGRCLYLDAARRIYSSGCHLTSQGHLSLNTDQGSLSQGAVQHGTLALTDHEVGAFRQELQELVDRYVRLSSDQINQSSREYSFMTAIAPSAP